MSRKEKMALISVSDKSGIVDFAKGLIENGFELISSGGTFKHLSDGGVPCRKVEDITGFPEILGGRVKTLHPNVCGGILARRSSAEHRKELEEQCIEPIDMVVVNLYPFEETVSRKGVGIDEAVEMIDIGGPSLIRSAAKNHNDVTVIVDPNDYGGVIEQLKENGEIPLDKRKDLALKAFMLSSSYDITIANWLRDKFHPREPWGDSLRLGFERMFDTRYGENPHQKGAYFIERNYKGVSIATSEILGGKELSFNNIYDVDAATDILLEFPDDPCCVIIKHNNPSGVAISRKSEGGSMANAFERAFECDPMSAFGGIIGLNRECDLRTAENINKRFFEVVIAPSYTDDALDELRRKKNLRIVRTNGDIVDYEQKTPRFVKIKGGMLVQTMEWPEWDPEQWKVVTEKIPSKQQIADLVFASKVTKHVKSNCVVMAKDLQTVGIGAGQMSRVDSCFMAGKKAGENGMGSVLSSDAFFPFRDGIDTSAEAGVISIAQPGGSIRDQEVIDAANDHGISMVFTGIRLFKH
jgi:phosphoribosylaminoimidazolecarboxamide formyltransferase/IMP cyclohydrolase